MTRTALFQSNRTQAMRLPKAVAFPESVREVEVTIDGPRRVIAPAGHSWDDFFAAPGIAIDAPTELEHDRRLAF